MLARWLYFLITIGVGFYLTTDPSPLDRWLYDWYSELGYWVLPAWIRVPVGLFLLWNLILSSLLVFIAITDLLSSRR